MSKSKESKANGAGCCRTSNLIDLFSKCLCLHPSPKEVYEGLDNHPGIRSKTPQKDTSIIAFVEKEKEEEVRRSRRRSRMICQSFFQSHVRVPLKMRQHSNLTEPNSPLIPSSKLS